jgi:hypothetical protein
MSNELTKPEVTTLSECENVIEAGQRTFIEVGQALLKIRDSRLYRAEHDTFENYCLSRWQMARAYALRLIGAAEVVKNLSPMGDIPATERVARPLTKLEPAQQREAWTKANETASAEDRPVSARHVEGAVIELAPRVRREKFTMPTQAMFLARGAVSQLERILPDDGERSKALRFVRDWCSEQLK